MIARKTMGGGIDIQSWIGLMAILTTGGLALGLYNIKRLQFDQHRAWMIRTWFYVSGVPLCFALLRISLIILQLHLTPEESKRLRQVSYERQLKAGHKHPGDSGLVLQPFRNIQEQGSSSPLGENIQPGSGDFSSGSGDSSGDEKMLA